MSDHFRKTVINKLNNGDFDCTKEFTVSMFSGKHKLMILWILINEGPKNYAYFMKHLNSISKKVLSNQFKELIDDQIVVKREYFIGKVMHTEYCLTEIGETLTPIIVSLNEWGQNRLNQLDIVKKFNKE